MNNLPYFKYYYNCKNTILYGNQKGFVSGVHSV